MKVYKIKCYLGETQEWTTRATTDVGEILYEWDSIIIEKIQDKLKKYKYEIIVYETLDLDVDYSDEKLKDFLNYTYLETNEIEEIEKYILDNIEYDFDRNISIMNDNVITTID